MPPLQSNRPQIGHNAPLPRRSRSPYKHHPQFQLREDSKGHIEGVEYLSGAVDLTSEDSEDQDTPQLRNHSSTSATAFSRRSFSKRNNDRRDSAHCRSSRRKSHSGTDTSTPTNSVRLCPSPGRRPSANFTLSSPEASGKDAPTDEEDDEDIPKLRLPERRLTSEQRRPQCSIRRSPLLNRDLLRFVSEAGGGRLDAEEGEMDLEPMMFELSLSGDEGWGFERARARGKGPRDEIEGPKGERPPGGERPGDVRAE